MNKKKEKKKIVIVIVSIYDEYIFYWYGKMNTSISINITNLPSIFYWSFSLGFFFNREKRKNKIDCCPLSLRWWNIQLNKNNKVDFIDWFYSLIFFLKISHWTFFIYSVMIILSLLIWTIKTKIHVLIKIKMSLSLKSIEFIRYLTHPSCSLL